jgi:hypothetical protein
MEKKIYICEFCQTAHETLDDYMTCVAKCGEDWKAKKAAEEKQKRLEEVNASLNRIKEAKKYYEEQLEKFEKEYPEEYKLNFGKNTCRCKDSDKNTKSETVEFSYKNNGKDEPKVNAKVNGEDVSINRLLSDPYCKYIAKMLGLE